MRQCVGDPFEAVEKATRLTTEVVTQNAAEESVLHMIRAKIAFAYLYPAVMLDDINSFDDLLNLLKSEDTRNPLHHLDKVSHPNWPSCQQFRSTMKLFVAEVEKAKSLYDDNANGKVRVFYKKDEAKQRLGNERARLWAQDTSPTVGSKSFIVCSEKQLWKRFNSENHHLYEHFQSMKCNTGGDQPTRFFVDADGERANESREATPNDRVLATWEMMSAMRAHHKEQTREEVPFDAFIVECASDEAKYSKHISIALSQHVYAGIYDLGERMKLFEEKLKPFLIFGKTTNVAFLTRRVRRPTFPAVKQQQKREYEGAQIATKSKRFSIALSHVLLVVAPEATTHRIVFPGSDGNFKRHAQDASTEKGWPGGRTCLR